MGNIQDKADFVSCPFGDGATTSVLKYACPIAARADLVPAAWHGRFVTMMAVGGNVSFFFSRQSSVVPDITLVAANDGGADPQLGFVLMDGQTKDCRIPEVEDSDIDAVYFCRDSDNGGAYVQMHLSSP